jgi:Xaa-Pro dipeptidase
MCVDRRHFITFSALSALNFGLESRQPITRQDPPVRKMADQAKPITHEEYAQRQENARRYMREATLGAVILTGGSSLRYFTGAKWGISERLFAAVLPAKGELGWIAPAFEKDRALEQIKFGTDLRTWEEDESPYRLVASILNDRGLRSGKIGIEETVQFRFSDGVARSAPAVQFTSADPVTAHCRRVKSAGEIELMRLANQITLKSYEMAVQSLKEGMTHLELAAGVAEAHRRLGADQGSALVLFAANAALPHGTAAVQKLREGDIVLIDGGCNVEGYHSDITRTIVFGKPTDEQRRVWDIVKQAQAASLREVRRDVPCEEVDGAARKVIEKAGFGPGYKYFTHRLGHGIGLDEHEWTYLVHGNKTKLEPGMVFSDEPGIYLPGQFGVRLEDIMVVTENGGYLLTGQATSIEQPF